MPRHHHGVLAALVLVGCAMPKGELGMTIQTTEPIARIELAEDTLAESLQVAAVPAGRSQHVLKTRPGRWCIVELVIANGAVGWSKRPGTEICAEVREGERGEFGVLSFDGGTMTRVGEGGAPPDEQFAAAGDDEQRPTLSTLEIKNALAPRKEEVRRCMSEQGLEIGTKIFVVLEFEGATGRATSVKVSPPFATAELESYVRAAMGGVKAPTFAQPKLGVSYPFVL
jgi:hypothetical protein